MPLILLTNDDGIEAEGLNCLADHLAGLADLVVVAPDRERSAVSHGLTIHTPLTLRSVRADRYVLDGTPADCVIYALRKVLKARPDMVISGINHGANLADDIMYSGTVAAAREASKHGIPSLAVSQAYGDEPIRFKEGARFVQDLVRLLLRRKRDGASCLNVNIPVNKIRGVKITRQGSATHFHHYNYLDEESLGGAEAYGSELRKRSEIVLDFQAVEADYVSITPLQRDQTDYPAAHSLAREAGRLFKEFASGE